MALKAGLKGLRSEAQGCARTTAHAADHARPTGAFSSLGVFLMIFPGVKLRLGGELGNFGGMLSGIGEVFGGRFSKTLLRAAFRSER